MCDQSVCHRCTAGYHAQQQIAAEFGIDMVKRYGDRALWLAVANSSAGGDGHPSHPLLHYTHWGPDTNTKGVSLTDPGVCRMGGWGWCVRGRREGLGLWTLKSTRVGRGTYDM